MSETWSPMEQRAAAMVEQAIPGCTTVPDARRILDSVRAFAREQDAALAAAEDTCEVEHKALAAKDERIAELTAAAKDACDVIASHVANVCFLAADEDKIYQRARVALAPKEAQVACTWCSGRGNCDCTCATCLTALKEAQP